ncbi:hypothetical protein PI124_g2661 [Phytophthora idaei]|nr:hypothetical protein PI126_g7946 [Phytophthora idaei]KAG3252737.1 hypothetical protein PI124_g2661 [Phytophthora idaei]
MEAATTFLEKLRSSLHGLHKEVLDEKERKRLQDMIAHKGTECNFEVGDFVLWPRIDQRLSNNKLLGQWVGPFQIIRSLPHAFVIKHLVTSREFEVHATRLKFYADRDFNVTTEILEFTTQRGMILGVEAITDHNDVLERWELRVSWCGLQSMEDSWVALTELLKDVPDNVKDYVLDSDDEELKQQLM